MKSIASIGRLIAVLAVGACLPTMTPRADVLRQWQDGEWTMRVTTNDQTKVFTGCTAARRAEAGQQFVLVSARDMTWTMGFVFPDALKGAAGSSALVDLRVGQGAKVTFNGTVLNPTTLTLRMPPDAQMLEMMRRGNTLTYAAQDGHHGAVELDGLARVSGELTQCTQAQLAAERPNGTVAAAQPGAPAAPPNPQAVAAMELRTTRIASNLLLHARLPNAHLLSSTEIPPLLRGLGTAWTSDTGIGAVLLIPNTPDKDEAHLALATITRGANNCKGEFAAGRSTSLVDGTMVARTFTACSDSDGARTVRYYIARQDPAYYTVFTTIPANVRVASQAVRPPNGTQQASVSETAPPPTTLPDDEFQAAAVKALRDQ